MTSAASARASGPLPTLALAALCLFGLTHCETDEPIETPDPPVLTAQVAIEGGVQELQLGDSVVFVGTALLDGEAPEEAVSWFWRLDSKPLDSVLVDQDLEGVGDSLSSVALLPDVQGLYGVTLQVGDGVRLSDLAHAVIQVGGGNTCPTSDAGADLVSQTGVPTVLDGSNTTDPDIVEETGDDDDDSAVVDGPQELTFQWHFSLVPGDSGVDDGDIFYQGTDHPTFIPDVAGTYILQLRASDGLCTSLPDYVTVQVTNGNLPPVAEAGDSKLLTPCSPTEVQLDGTSSFDPEGQAIDYAWSITSVPNGSQVIDALVEGRFTATPSFNWDVPGLYTVELRVHDGQQGSEPSYVAVQAVPSLPNEEPVAFAGEDIVVEASASCIADPYTGGSCNPCGSRSIVVDGSGAFDPDGDQLNYQWDLQSGDATLLGENSDQLEVTLPEVPVSFGGTTTVSVEVALTVFDCRSAADDTVTITFICEG